MWGEDGFGDTGKALFAPKQIIKTIDLLLMHYDLILEKLKTCLWFLTDEEPESNEQKVTKWQRLYLKWGWFPVWGSFVEPGFLGRIPWNHHPTTILFIKQIAHQ